MHVNFDGRIFQMSPNKYVNLLNKLLVIFTFILIFVAIFQPQKSSNPPPHTEPTQTHFNIQNLTSKVIQPLTTETDPNFIRTLPETVLRNQRRKIRLQEAFIFKNQSIFEHNSNIHIFYFTWFQNPEFDDEYQRWDLPYISDWNRNSKVPPPRMPLHQPPMEISANYYPFLGCYSSNDPIIGNPRPLPSAPQHFQLDQHLNFV